MPPGRHVEYRDLEQALRCEAKAVEARGESWTAAEVARKLNEVADLLEKIRRQHQTGINASMGKRSGTSPGNI